MNGSGWTTRAATRIDTWPVGPIAGLMLGGATAFFCWAMRFAEAAPMAVIVPAVLAAGLTWAVFSVIEIRAAVDDAACDEGDEQEDWLTRPSQHRPDAIRGTQAPMVRPLTLDAIADYVPPPSAMPAADDDAQDDGGELLLDAMADRFDQRAAVPVASINALMDRLAAGMAAITPAAEHAPVAARVRPPSPPAATPVALLASPDRADGDDELRAALAGLHRMAARRG